MVDEKKSAAPNFGSLNLQQLDDWYDKNLKKYESESGSLDFGDDPNGEFYALIEQYERYLDARNRILSHMPVATKAVVADAEAVATTLKTYHAINTKIQQQIEHGTDLHPNDIKLLVEMMKALNGDR